MAVLQDININVYAQPSDKRLRTFLSLSQNENGRLINFRILGSPLPSNCTAVFSGTKPDGTVYTTTGTVTGNFVIVQEDMQMTAVPGVWDANLDVVNGTHNIVTAIIRVIVERGAVAPGSVPSNSQLDGYVAQCKSYAEHARTDAYGSPLTATTAAEMTDKTRVYVYTGSETGMTAGNWYYWNGSAWVSGGVYNAVAVQTDTTLSVAGKAADGKAAGDAIEELKEDLNAFVNTGETILYNDTVSGTRVVIVDVNIPAGTYNLHIDSITSSDTDSDKSTIQYRYESGRLDKVYERGVEIDSTVTFTAPVVHLAFLAAQSLNESTGDSFEYSGVKLYVERLAKKEDLDAAKVDICELQEDLSSTKEEIDNKVVYGLDIVFGDEVTGKYRTNGAYVTDSLWLSSYTSVLPCKPNCKYLYSGWAGIGASDCPAALFYNANGDFLSSVSLIDNAFGYGIITIPNNVYGVRFQLAHRATSLADTPSVTVIDPVMFDDIATETKALKNAYDKSEFALAIAPTNLLDEIDKSDWAIGSLNVDTGAVDSNAYYVTGYIPIKPYTVYSITGSACVCDADRTYLGKSLIANNGYFYTTDARAKYAKYCIRIDNYVSGNCYFKKYTARDDVRTIEVTDAAIDALTNGGLLDVAGNDNFHFKKTNNLFNLNTTEWLYRMSINTANGVPIPNLNPDGAISIMFIPVEDGDTICSNMAPWGYVLYNADKAFIGAGTPDTLNKEDSVYICHVPTGSSASYMGITLKFNKDGGHGNDTDAPNGWIRSDAEISKVVIWKAQGEKLYPLDESVNRNPSFYKLLGDYVEPNYNALPDKDSEFFRMIRCEAIRAVNHTKHIYRIGCFNKYVVRKQYNWPHIKKMLADYGIDICGFNEAQYSSTQDAYKKASLGDYLKGWQFGYSATFYPLGTTESPYSNRDMVSMFPVVESEELFFPPDSRYGQYNNRSALRTKIKLPRYLDCTGGEQYLGFYVIHPTVAGTDLANLQKQEFQVCLDAMETDGCAFHIIAADSNAFDFDPNTHMPITWDWLVSKGFKLANDGLSKTVTAPSPDHGGSIDQIFVSSNINVLNWNVINGYDYAYTENSNAGYVPISDHDFVYADIEFDYSDVVTRLIPMTEIALIQTLDHVSSDTMDNYHIPITRNQQGKAVLTDAITVTLTPDSGYTLSTVTVKVGGTNKTSDYYSNGVVSIPAGTQVSGDVEIIATATE